MSLLLFASGFILSYFGHSLYRGKNVHCQANVYSVRPKERPAFLLGFTYKSLKEDLRLTLCQVLGSNAVGKGMNSVTTRPQSTAGAPQWWTYAMNIKGVQLTWLVRSLDVRSRGEKKAKDQYEVLILLTGTTVLS